MSYSLTIPSEEKDKKALYKLLIPQIEELVKDEDDLIANLSNIIAALKNTMNFLFEKTMFLVPSIMALNTENLNMVW